MPAVLERMCRGETVTSIAATFNLTGACLSKWGHSTEWAERWRDARTAQAYVWADECISIADGSDRDALARAHAIVAEAEAATDDEDKRERIIQALAAQAVQRDRLRVDTRKWYASKLAPKVLGDKLDLTTGGQALPGAVVLPAEAWGAAIAAGAAAGAGAVFGAIAAGAHNRIEGEPGAGALIAPAPAVTSGGVG